MTEQRAKWPKYLLVPSEDQFYHGDYISFDHSKVESDSEDFRMSEATHCARADILEDEDREALKFHCGTACCLVGWACLAFGESGCEPSEIRNPATVEFLNKFLELAGVDPHEQYNPSLESFESFAKRVARNASDVFEGTDSRGNFTTKRLSPQRARSLWKKTGDFFNYDTANPNLLDD